MTLKEWCEENNKEDLLNEWHLTKNGDLKPTNVTYGSGRKVWWMCPKGHTWKAVINSRTYYNVGCPYCSNRAVLKGYNDLATIEPDLAKEWHPTRNGNLKPTDVARLSSKKVWWQCAKGHEYPARIFHRSQGTGCPYCAGQQVLNGSNDLATAEPDIAKEWHPTKNGNLRPTDVTRGCTKKFWWRCAKGHEWEASVNSRTNNNKKHGCPICSGQRVLKGLNDLATVMPDIAKEWHPTRNEDLKPTDVTKGSNKKVWWQCSLGHEWEASVCSRTSTTKPGCPVCSGHKILKGFNDLATVRPDIAKEWHPTKNGNLRPTDVTEHNNKRIWWQCSLGHEWEAIVYSQTNKKGISCPYCSKKKRMKNRNFISIP